MAYQPPAYTGYQEPSAPSMGERAPPPVAFAPPLAVQPVPVIQQPPTMNSHNNNSNVVQGGNTTIQIGYPLPAPTVGVGGGGVGGRKPPRLWKYGLFSCFEDCGVLIYGCCCPACMLKQVSEAMGEGWCMPCIVPSAATLLRTKWRTQENIKGTIMNDWLTTSCCFQCALCQLTREIKQKGITQVI